MNDEQMKYLSRIVRIIKDIIDDEKMSNEDKIRLIGVIF